MSGFVEGQGEGKSEGGSGAGFSGEADRMAWMEGWRRERGGGLLFRDAELISRQKGVVMDLLKNFGAQVLAGKGHPTLSLPIRIFSAESALQRMTVMWQSAPSMLRRAAAAGDDPLARFGIVMGFAISGLHLGLNQWKPFNPILGETFQGHYPDGTQVFIEQTSHHPPVSNFLLESPDGSFTVHGVYHWGAGFSGNSVKQRMMGTTEVHFADGGCVRYTLPYVKMSGVIMGDRVVEWQGNMVLEDEQNGFRCDFEFDPSSGLFAKNRKPTDYFRGRVVNPATGAVVVDRAEGSWLDNCTMGSTEVWNVQSEPIYPVIPEENPIASDCRFREDLVQLAAGNSEQAQEDKLRLEHIQRTDRNNRRTWAERSGRRTGGVTVEGESPDSGITKSQRRPSEDAASPAASRAGAGGRGGTNVPVIQEGAPAPAAAAT